MGADPRKRISEEQELKEIEENILGLKKAKKERLFTMNMGFLEGYRGGGVFISSVSIFSFTCCLKFSKSR